MAFIEEDALPCADLRRTPRAVPEGKVLPVYYLSGASKQSLWQLPNPQRHINRGNFRRACELGTPCGFCQPYSLVGSGRNQVQYFKPLKPLEGFPLLAAVWGSDRKSENRWFRHRWRYTMPCPFPGMDPYLEDDKLWPPFQHQLVACLYQILLPGLVDRYRARINQRTYVSEQPLFTSIIR